LKRSERHCSLTAYVVPMGRFPSRRHCIQVADHSLFRTWRTRRPDRRGPIVTRSISAGWWRDSGAWLPMWPSSARSATGSRSLALSVHAKPGQRHFTLDSGASTKDWELPEERLVRLRLSGPPPWAQCPSVSPRRDRSHGWPPWAKVPSLKPCAVRARCQVSA
jgi:hypothetical protein